MSQGKGISDAVRESISTWITSDLVRILWSQFPDKDTMSEYGFRRRLESDREWARRVRRLNGTGGWERDYDCKAFPRGVVGLRVHTDTNDEYIKYVTFRINGKLIGGGVVNVPSVLIQGIGVRRTIRTTDTGISEATPRFRPFTAEQILQLSTELEYGDASIMDRMFEERD